MSKQGSDSAAQYKPGHFSAPNCLAALIVFLILPMGTQGGTTSGTPAPQLSAASVAIDRAAAAKRYLFILFQSDKGKQSIKSAFLGGGAKAEQSAAAKAVFKSAAQSAADRADAVLVNIDDPAEKDVVKKFGVERAPMPMALVLAPNGAVTGGFPGKFTEEQLLGSFVAPAMEKCLKTLQDRKLVFLCIQNAKTQNNEAALKGVREFTADARFAAATEVINIDPSDKSEAKTLAQFQVDSQTKEAVTVFLAPPGVPIAQVKGATDKSSLVSKLTAAAASCGSGCGPGGCGPVK